GNIHSENKQLGRSIQGNATKRSVKTGGLKGIRDTG
ncbi:unnamed protein product, partial [marine sediment metagenome]